MSERTNAIRAMLSGIRDQIDTLQSQARELWESTKDDKETTEADDLNRDLEAISDLIADAEPLDEDNDNSDDEDDEDVDDSYPPPCSDSMGHEWVISDHNEEITYCSHCGADGNA